MSLLVAASSRQSSSTSPNPTPVLDPDDLLVDAIDAIFGLDALDDEKRNLVRDLVIGFFANGGSSVDFGKFEYFVQHMPKTWLLETTTDLGVGSEYSAGYITENGVAIPVTVGTSNFSRASDAARTLQQKHGYANTLVLRPNRRDRVELTFIGRKDPPAYFYTLDHALIYGQKQNWTMDKMRFRIVTNK